MRSAKMRAIASEGPPAENGTTMVIGCVGKVSAAAPPIVASMTANATETILLITPSVAPATERDLELRKIDRLMTIERARDRRQRIFESGSAVEKHNPVILCHT